ncbi:MAG: DUF4438 domain-containing protein [Candidatus Sabulitectum sp.]|nr:DUF4438 domain-containing protein [Candidatus Sabulitectum sp.]
MLKTNEKRLVQFSLECKPGHPFAGNRLNVDHLGKPFQLPGIGGITLNIQAGDSVYGWVGDHIEPGVSCKWGDKRNENPNQSFQILACAGNEAVVTSGKAKGARGVVLGHHGGSEHLIIDFDKKTKEKLSYEDTIRLVAVGMGLEITTHPEIRIVNLAPSLLKKMGIRAERKTGKLIVPVAAKIPSECMGSGIGATNTSIGDYDIMTSDWKTVIENKMDKMRFGDFVALMDQDNRFGRAHRKGAVTIGIVIHSDCRNSGHGPGVTTLLSCGNGEIEPVIDPAANIADVLKIGNCREKK